MRVGRRMLETLREALSNRDVTVVALVAQHRYLTTAQVERFVFTDHVSADSAARTTRRVLARLERAGLLRRLYRRIGGVRAGSAATVWQVTPAAVRLLQSDTSASSYRTHEPSPRFLDHCLAVADTHLALHAVTDMTVVESLAVEVEPDSWRRYQGDGGEVRWLQPDLAATISTADYEDRWFVEVDCGTESLPTLLRKCHQYERYRASGAEQHRHGAFPLVLWVFAGQRQVAALERLARLRTAVHRTSGLTPPLYRYATTDTVTSVVAQQADDQRGEQSQAGGQP